MATSSIRYTARAAADTPSPVPGLIAADHFAERSGYHVRRANGTRDWLITYTIAGGGRYVYGEGVLSCRAGDVVLLAPSTPHDYAIATGEEVWDFYWAHFTPPPHWANWFQLPQIAPGLFSLHIDDQPLQRRLTGVFQRLIADSNAMGTLHAELALNAVEEALILLARQQEHVGKGGLDPRIKTVLERLSVSLTTTMSVEELAREVALSPSRLAHLFKAQVGDSIIRMHMKLRLRHAARLLEFSNRSISEIAQSAGFQSSFYFSHQFKAYYGMSPLTYRRHVTAE